jgi:putative DNA primase/helicase
MNFIQFARAHGVEVDYDRLYPSDKIRRTGTVLKPRSTNGSYFWDGKRGWVMDWSGEAKVVWYNDPDAKPWSEDEKRAWGEKRRAQVSDQQKKYDAAAQHAQELLKMAKMESHPYLEYKGFKEEKGFVLDNKLLVPMRNVSTSKLQGYQEIYFDYGARKYEKKMMFGMRAKNAVFYIGARQVPETWLVEGYATGLSLHKALRTCGLKSSVVVCFSASNLIAVADQIPNQRFVFADNDLSGTGQKAAQETGLPWTMADEVGNDSNDLHVKHGLFAVVGKVMELRKSVLTCAEAH